MTIQEYNFLQVRGDQKVKVFISWSGNKSRDMANFLREWMKDVNFCLETWASDKDIDSGAVWFKEICDNIRETANSVIVVTKENKDNPWIMFEAGALSRGDDRNRVTLLLLDLEAGELSQPLASFNAIRPTKDGMWKLMLNLTRRHNEIVENLKKRAKDKNEKRDEYYLDEDRLKRLFDSFYPDFEQKLQAIKEIYPDEPTVHKSPEELRQIEIINSLRSIERELLDAKDFMAPDLIYNIVEDALDRCVSHSFANRLPFGR